MHPRSLTTLSLLVAALAALASAWALLTPDLYANDPEVIAPQLLGQDLVTLALAAPALAAAAWLARRGGSRAAIAEAGLLLYMAYTYATYALGARFNVLFVVYCAVLGMGTYGLFLAVPRLLRATPRPSRPLPRRTLIGVPFAIATVFVLLWGTEIVIATLSGDPPPAALEAETPTSLIHVLDLSFVLPLGFVAGTLLLLRRDAGIPLAGVFLVKALTIALAVLSMGLFAWRADDPVNVPVAGSMLGVVVLVLLVGWRYARALAPARPVREAPRSVGA